MPLPPETGLILVTGTAGFIGFHVARRLLESGHRVTGIDAMTPYYDVRLKRDRNAILSNMEGFAFHEFDLQDFDRLMGLVETIKPKLVIHLAAQAGVRYSIENPRSYINATSSALSTSWKLADTHRRNTR